MKYVIRYTCPVPEITPAQWLPCLYHKHCFVNGANEEVQGTASSKLSEAELFDTYQDAAHIIEQVYSEIANASKKYAECLEIVGTTKLEIFKAKLADK